MSGNDLHRYPELRLKVAGGDRQIAVRPERLIVAGYTGRDREAVQRHIDELERAGIAPPPSVPMLYEVDASLLTGEPTVALVSAESSGEVEPVYIRCGGDWYLGVGSDHTDRALERADVARSKAACPKPLGDTVVALPGDPLSGHHDAEWDRSTIRSEVDGAEYQSGGLTELMRPSDLLPLVVAPAGQEAPQGDLVIFGGTVPLLGGEFVFGRRWLVELSFGQQTIRHSYSLGTGPAGAARTPGDPRKGMM